MLKDFRSEDHYVLRFFCRNAPQFQLARYEINLTLPTDFFMFPNYYFNLILIRDERNLKLL